VGWGVWCVGGVGVSVGVDKCVELVCVCVCGWVGGCVEIVCVCVNVLECENCSRKFKKFLGNVLSDSLRLHIKPTFNFKLVSFAANNIFLYSTKCSLLKIFFALSPSSHCGWI
jgi:hypothetical protein